MRLDRKILECEFEYTKCFSEFSEDENVIRFRDHQLKDMYYHNYTYIQDTMDGVRLKRAIEKEIALRQSEKSSFCNILFDAHLNNDILSMLEFRPEISRSGFYSYDLSYHEKLKIKSGCIVKRVEDPEMLDHLLYCDLQQDEAHVGKDFCTRRCYRRGKIYISSEGVDSYICYHDGVVIGNCDLFIHNGIAKIEDFAVIPSHQRKGYGTTILHYLIGRAIQEKCHTIYLVTDEDDTAKEMYQKIGFNKIGERIDLFINLK
ncbi:GNAT family N-acetyltransferase [Alkaliphilus hydrothermalis]|uniref:Spore maturation protein CgeE n=1 Tax=Alkaliphilus hydrothermalis TaxID=1482730 RepID=A0ABS2NSF6_9FIRM|nr:GNAT family N-acetyltransferase [Alkaliphilus hydrothermalis]MBM7615904.1 spore maturation protein CgeE [Alkaliphilus hydrothermalis]